jgi:hypothetical protein
VQRKRCAGVSPELETPPGRIVPRSVAMLRIQLPERSSFRFGRKSYTETREKASALEEMDTELKIPPHTPLPLVHHTSTKSLFDLFQPQDESAYGVQTLKNEIRAILSPASARSMPEDLEKPVLEMRSVSPFDALGSHRDPRSMASMPTTTPAVIPALAFENEYSTASTPSSGFRENDDASGCSRKSSTSSVGTPLAGHKAYFDAIAALDKETGFVEVPLLHTQQMGSPKGPRATPTRSIPHYDKPLPPAPSPESPFSVSSVLSIMRAESFSKTRRQPPMQMVADAPIIFRRQSQARPSHVRSASDGVLCSKISTTFKVKSPTTSPRSKRGARLGNAMSQGRLHTRAHTLSNLTSPPPGSAQPERPRPLSMSFNNISTPIQPKDGRNRERKSGEEPPISISPSAAEKVVLEIMRRLDEPADLLAIAAVNRGFRGTFKRAEPRILHELLLRQCPAAWEFQKNSAQASGDVLSLRTYTKDKAALTFVKSALLASCGTVLQPETMAGLTGADVARQSRIDTALWRIWTFCKGFGHRSLSEDDIPIQVDWLNGGRIARKRQLKTAVGRGNRKGLSVTDLEDALELWDHLGKMLSSFNNDVAAARAGGIFERCSIDENHTQEWFLMEWTYYIRSLGLPAVLSVFSATSFEQVQASGFTDWTPPSHGQTRAGFFRAAVSSVYQERILAEAAAKATQFALPPRSQHRPSASDASIGSLEQLTRALEKRAAQQQNLKIITSPGQVRRKPVLDSSMPKSTWQPETPDTPYPVQRHDPRQRDPGYDQQETEHDVQRDSLRDSFVSPIRNSVVLQSLGMTSTVSTRLGATLFPMEYPPTSPQNPVLCPFSSAQLSRPPPRRSASPSDDLPPVIDPADKAIKLLTQDMGFSVAEASRALAKCDTGFGIDVQKAIEMLARESGRNLSPAPQPKTSTPASPIDPSAPTSPVKARMPRDSCSGHHERTTSDGSNISVEATKPFEPLCDTHPVRQPSLLGNLNRNSLRSLTRMGSRAKTYKVLVVDKLDKSSRALGAEEGRPPRVSSLKATHGSIERPWQPLPAGQRPTSKMPPRKAKSAHRNKLMGIDEEPSMKAMQILGVDEVGAVNGRISQAASATKSKSKPAKRFYEGRFSNLGRSDAASAK